MNHSPFPLPEFKAKAVRSYVIRGGRITEAQRKAFDRYWPQFGLSLHTGLLDADVTFGREAPLAVEVGFGNGDSLLAMALAEPDKNFVGVDVHPPGVGRLLNNAGKTELPNLRIYMADAIDVLSDCLPANCIDRFQLYFPDPWPKTKHHKRRLVQPEFIHLVAQKLKPGGLIHMATDWENYAEQMLDVLETSPGLKNTAGPGAYSPRPEFRPLTKFEQRGERLGHGVWDLVYEKRDSF